MSTATATTLPTLTIRPCDPAAFASAFDAARDASPMVREYTSPWDGTERGTFYLSGDSLSGFRVAPGGELCQLFSVASGRGHALVAAAIGAGAVRLDCFDGYLPALYSSHGFSEVRRESNWTPGGPDVVYMSRVGTIDKVA